jgi:hypothetical protein
MRVNASQMLSTPGPHPGQEALLNEDLNVVGLGDFGSTGEVVTLLDVPGDRRREEVAACTGAERVAPLAKQVRQANPLPEGKVLMYPHSDGAVELLSESTSDANTAEGSPSVGYADLGGLTAPSIKLRDFPDLISGALLHDIANRARTEG